MACIAFTILLGVVEAVKDMEVGEAEIEEEKLVEESIENCGWDTIGLEEMVLLLLLLGIKGTKARPL